MSSCQTGRAHAQSPARLQHGGYVCKMAAAAMACSRRGCNAAIRSAAMKPAERCSPELAEADDAMARAVERRGATRRLEGAQVDSAGRAGQAAARARGAGRLQAVVAAAAAAAVVQEGDGAASALTGPRSVVESCCCKRSSPGSRSTGRVASLRSCGMPKHVYRAERRCTGELCKHLDALVTGCSWHRQHPRVLRL